jgi:hypothetical protein
LKKKNLQKRNALPARKLNYSRKNNTITSQRFLTGPSHKAKAETCDKTFSPQLTEVYVTEKLEGKQKL